MNSETMNDLDTYINAKANTAFDLRTNNCLHFVLGFHGLTHLVPKDCDVQWGEDYVARVDRGLVRNGFKRTNERIRGNIVAVKDGYLTKPALGLRLSDDKFVLMSEMGMLRTFIGNVIGEWACRR